MITKNLKTTLTLLALASFGVAPAVRAETQSPTQAQLDEAGLLSLTFDQCANTYTATYECGPDTTCETSGSANDLDGALSAATTTVSNAVCTGNPDNSFIDNTTFNLRHFGFDYSPAAGSGSIGCSSCGQSTSTLANNTFARVSVKRTQSLREITQPSSLGPGIFLNYDLSLSLFEVNGVTYIDAFNPAWLGIRRYSPSGTEFTDTIYRTVKTVRLFDAAGNKTTSRVSAVRAEIVGRNGDMLKFELFDLDANRKGGRLVATTDASGKQVLGFTYATPADDATAAPEAKWLKSGATDLHGDALTYTYATHATGRSVLTAIAIPGGRTLRYAYDAAGNLARVEYPTSDVATFERTVENGVLKMVMRDAGETTTHRNKTAYLSNNIAASLLSWNNNSRPVMYNQSSQLLHVLRNGSGELRYAAIPGGNGSGGAMHRRIYEGGGRLKFIDTAEKSSYKSWSLPNGLNLSNAYGSFAVTKEKYGHLSPYWQYAANRSRQPVQVTNPESPVNYYLYDGAGNLRLQRLGGQTKRVASDARFNKPILSVDFSGKAEVSAYDASGNLISRKTGWAYDNALGAGVSIPGLKCTYFENLATLDDIATATPVSVQQADTVALGQRETPAAKWGMRFDGKLVLETAGERTFYFSADDRARLYIDGVLVSDVAYNQGTKTAKVALTAGAHDIRVDFYEIGGAQRLDLTWSGPETTDAFGVAARTILGSNFLTHETTADELVLRATADASEEKWEYYPTGHALAGLQKAYVDGSGKRSEYEYDTNRRLITVKETGDAGALVVTQRRTYDAAGNLASQSDALGRTVTYTYDARNRLVKTAYADGATETSLYGTGVDANLVVQTKNRAGSVTKTEYDASGRAVRILSGYALANLEGEITSVLEKPSVETRTYLDGTADPIRIVRDGKVTEREYDYKGRLTVERSFPAQGKSLVTKSTYNADEVLFSREDAHGCRTFFAYRRPDMQVIREVRELVPGSLGTVADEAAVLALARATGANPGHAITDYAKDLDGRTLITTDALGVKTMTVYDAAARVAAVTRAAELPEAVTTRNTYDGAGRVLTQTDALGRVTRREYTPAGRVAAVVYPDNTREEFTYFDDGKLATRKDADGFTSKQFWSACCGRELGSANALGEGLLKFSDGEGRVTYTVTVKNVEAAKAALDFAAGITLPSDAVVSASTAKYDARGRLAATTKWLTVPAGVDPKNPPVATDATQGLTTTYAYYDDLADARFAPVLAELAKQSIVLTAGAATVVTNPAGESSFTVTDGAGRTVASGVFNK